MSDDNILQWNVPNWISVVLIAVVFYGVLGVVQKYVQSKSSS